jgi:hypothetical protein
LLVVCACMRACACVCEYSDLEFVSYNYYSVGRLAVTSVEGHLSALLKGV